MKSYSAEDGSETTLFNVLYIINVVLIFLHAIILFMLYRNTMHYVAQFGESRVDPYTLMTLVLLGLSTILLLLNLPWLVLRFIDA